MAKKFKPSLLLSVLLCLGTLLNAQHKNQTGFDLAVGTQSFYAPFIKARPTGLQPVAIAGVNHPFNARNTFSVTLRIGYGRHSKQGDAIFTHLMFNYTPTLFRHLELGVGAGAGYQWAFYPGKALQWNGEEWVKGKSCKGVVQVPLRFSVGFKHITAAKGAFTPYLAYQVHGLFRYNPSLTPLPVSNFLLGVKYVSTQK
ncbi:MAG: hypothetical protein J0M29_21730 [Chitinophagales bacterium]|nr:hypothetical protein [Chitinophagales bacterium]